MRHPSGQSISSMRVLAVILVALLAATYGAGVVAKQLAWDPSDFPEVAGYIVFHGDAQGNSEEVLAETPPHVVTLELTRELGLTPGVTYCFGVKYYDLAGNIGRASNIVCDVAIEPAER